MALPKNCASLAKVSNSGKDSTYGLEPATTEGVSLLRTLRRRWLIIVITTLLAGAAAAAFAYGNRKDYESTAKLVFRQTIGTELNSLGLIPQSADADNLAQNDVQLVDSRRVAVASVPELRNRGIDLSADDVEDDVTVSSEKTDDVVSVTAKADSAEHAGALAQVYATTAQRVALDDQKELAGRALANLREQFAELPRDKQVSHLGTGNWLRGQIAKMRLIQAVGNGSPQIIQPGYVPTGKAGNPIQTVILGVLFGLMLGVALALLREQGDRRLHGAEEASVAFDAPVLTTVPRHRSLKRHMPFADLPPEVAEAFRMLQMKLRYGRDEPVQSVLITSSRTEEGKTTVAWNLACAGVSAGLDVALVETDMRRPTLAERYDLQPGPGVTEVVEGRTELSDALQPVSNVRGSRHGHQPGRPRGRATAARSLGSAPVGWHGLDSRDAEAEPWAGRGGHSADPPRRRCHIPAGARGRRPHRRFRERHTAPGCQASDRTAPGLRGSHPGRGGQRRIRRERIRVRPEPADRRFPGWPPRHTRRDAGSSRYASPRLTGSLGSQSRVETCSPLRALST